MNELEALFRGGLKEMRSGRALAEFIKNSALNSDAYRENGKAYVGVMIKADDLETKKFCEIGVIMEVEASSIAKFAGGTLFKRHGANALRGGYKTVETIHAKSAEASKLGAADLTWERFSKLIAGQVRGMGKTAIINPTVCVDLHYVSGTLQGVVGFMMHKIKDSQRYQQTFCMPGADTAVQLMHYETELSQELRVRAGRKVLPDTEEYMLEVCREVWGREKTSWLDRNLLEDSSGDLVNQGSGRMELRDNAVKASASYSEEPAPVKEQMPAMWGAF
jgi:hypothetical protein